MGLFVEFDVVDDFGYMSSTETFKICPPYSIGNEIFIQTFLDIADELVPVDTGYLSSTITAYSDGTSCWAETDCEYAQYPEYGTWCQEAQPYFTPALEEALDAAKPYWDDAVQWALDLEAELCDEMEEQRKDAEEAEMEKQEEFYDDYGYDDDEYYDEGGLTDEDAIIEAGNLAAAMFLAIMITLIQLAFGVDFREINVGFGRVYIPDVIIT